MPQFCGETAGQCVVEAFAPRHASFNSTEFESTNRVMPHTSSRHITEQTDEAMVADSPGDTLDIGVVCVLVRENSWTSANN
jgi:hypothetical protein